MGCPIPRRGQHHVRCEEQRHLGRRQLEERQRRRRWADIGGADVAQLQQRVQLTHRRLRKAAAPPAAAAEMKRRSILAANSSSAGATGCASTSGGAKRVRTRSERSDCAPMAAAKSASPRPTWHGTRACGCGAAARQRATLRCDDREGCRRGCGELVIVRAADSGVTLHPTGWPREGITPGVAA